jgi:hypothetical protein
MTVVIKLHSRWHGSVHLLLPMFSGSANNLLSPAAAPFKFLYQPPMTGLSGIHGNPAL